MVPEGPGKGHMTNVRALNFRSDMNAAAYEYWCGLTDGDRLPGRRHIDPSDMLPFLPYVMLMDVIREPELDFRYRLIGTKHQSFWLKNLTGVCIRATEQQGPGSTIWKGLERAATTAMPMSTRAPYVGTKKEIYEIEDILMPLAEDGRTVDMIFVCCDYLTKPVYIKR